MPVFTPRALVSLYQPLRAYLEQRLGRAVVLETATDFRAFYRHLSAGVYDLALAPAHLTRLVQQEIGWQPVAIYTAPNRAYVIMSHARPVRDIGALRGQRLAIFDPLALNVMITLAWLRAQGLEPGRDFEVVETPGHASVAYAVVNGDALLGVTAQAAVAIMPAELRDKFAIFAVMPRIPSLVWGVHPRLAAEAQRLQQLLLAFPDSAEGREFFRNTPYGGLRRIEAHELKSVEPYLPELIERLRGRP
ncbi:MAG: phosphate/phosphite/phosphonate ABC transporter substrate-binding protein [Thiobacillaceae bacterium]|nr:phosphate/phosphite/phosphonate ABC transporter substrate-binding protein [Thiobacillaceae bacterium]